MKKSVELIECRYCSGITPADSVFCCRCGERLAKAKRSAGKKAVKVPEPKQLPSGSYFIQLRIKDEYGAVTSVSITKDTYNECKSEALAIKSGVLEYKKAPEKITLTKAIDRYIENKSSVLSPETIRTYRGYQRNRFSGLMQITVADITKDKAQAAINKEKAAGITAKTIKAAWLFCNTVITGITGAPVKVQLPQVIKAEKKILSPDETKVFCKAIKGDEIEIAALLALSSLRRSEILALTWNCIDLNRKTITVRGAVVYDENNQVVRKDENKNMSSQRVVPIMSEQLYQALAAMKGAPDEAVVAFAPNTIARKINRICKANNLPEIGVHGLRHTFASLAAYLGLTEEAAMDIGGWQNPGTMRAIYTHTYQQDIDRSQNQLAQFFNSGSIESKAS